MISQLLDFPILSVRNELDAQEYPNPFDFFDIRRKSVRNGMAISEAKMNAFLDEAASDNSVTRRRAVTTLGQLHGAGLLDNAATRQFAERLWSQVDDHGLPSGTNYYRYSFLSLPHPGEVDPTECFVRYVRDARFPVQESSNSTRYGISGTGEVALCRDIRGASEVAWSTDDLAFHSASTRAVVGHG